MATSSLTNNKKKNQESTIFLTDEEIIKLDPKPKEKEFFQRIID